LIDVLDRNHLTEDINMNDQTIAPDSKSPTRRLRIAIGPGLLIVALLGYASYRLILPSEQFRLRTGRGLIGGVQPVGVATVARGELALMSDAGPIQA
jgi:hypothetical protein